MKKMTKKALGLMLAVCLAAGVFPAAGADVRAQEKEGMPGGAQCQEIYEGSNINAQDYSNSNFISELRAKQAESYLTPMPDGGLMRVQAQAQADEDGGSYWVLVEYYDASRKAQVSKTKRIKLDLPRFGGFYAAPDAYYILSGQKNFEQSADTEVLRITKYDKDWNRISSEGMKDCNTAEFFAGGCTRMEAYGRYLLIHTSHTTYKAADGLNHQANATIQYDMQEGKVTDQLTVFSNIGDGYVSHSWNQFLHIEDGRLITVDQGDGAPRSIVLVKYPRDVSTGKFLSGEGYLLCHDVDIMEFPGGYGDNWTGASVGGFEISDSSYLVAGNSAIRGEERGNTNNVFVAAVDKGTDEVATTWLTDYAEGEESTSTPHMAKLSDSRFVVLWSRGDRVHYAVVDGKGNVEASYDMEGELSDCAPVVSGGKVTWYTWNNEKITFYDMDVSDLSSCKKTVVTGGHLSYEFAGTKDGVITYQCINCGQQKQEAVYTSYDLNLYNSKGDDLEDESDAINFHRCRVGDKVNFTIYAPEPDCGMEVNNEWSIEVSDEERMRCTVTGNRLSSDGVRCISGSLEALSPGAASISICPKYNPDIKKTYDLTVSSPTEGVEISHPSLKWEVSEVLEKVDDHWVSVEVSHPSLEMEAGETVQIGTVIKPASADQRARYGTSNSLLSINADGFVSASDKVSITAVKNGTSQFYVYTPDGKSVTCWVTIRDHAHEMAYHKGIAASCTQAGKKAYYECGKCQKCYSDQEGRLELAEFGIPALGHDFSDYRFDEGSASDTEDGTETAKCSRCDATDTRTAEGTKLTGQPVGAGKITEAKVTLEKDSYVYDGTAKKPAVAVELNGKELAPGTDYTVSYHNNVNVGTATVTVTGIGNYTGSKTAEFTITEAAEDTKRIDISKADVTLSKTSYAYDGKPKTPSVTVKLGTETLSLNTDYTVSYSNNINIGTAKAAITGKGDYTGSKSANFTIEKTVEQPDSKITCKKTVYKVAYGAKPFKINASSNSSMTFTSSNPKVAAVDKNTGKVTIKNTGTASITIKTGKASKKVAIKVSPKKPSVKSAKAAKGRKLAVGWAKDKRASGYQVQVSTDKKFKKGMKSKNLPKTAYTFTKLKTGKKYYVRVRSYKKSGKETLYSAWSKAKLSGKVKK